MANYTKAQCIAVITQMFGYNAIDASRITANLSANGVGPYTPTQILALLHREGVATPELLARHFK